MLCAPCCTVPCMTAVRCSLHWAEKAKEILPPLSTSEILQTSWSCKRCYDLAGEILPQALCKSYALVIGAHTAWLVKFLMWACGIISWPISKLLDWLLGSEHTVGNDDSIRLQEGPLYQLLMLHLHGGDICLYPSIDITRLI